jgi:eukaryotic-like serine/threonine-protein kinase
MSAERWRLIEEHFDVAVTLPPDQRAAYIDRVSANDSALRAELRSLVAASESASTFLEHGAAPPDPYLEAAEGMQPGSRLGAWRIVRLIGRGGMGEVYEAQRADGQFEQRAALKLTRREAARLLDRFNAERQILARLDHPGLVRLLDGGVAADGRPYAVMEYVEGQTITRHCDEKRAGLRERLNLFLQVCDAVSHAHRHLIVHRDIKPGNVLVDSDSRARLLDFGVAKPLDPGMVGTADVTEAPLTPDYAAPEQLSGEPVTTATDVYALGVLLFELLSGRKPWSLEGQPLARALHTLLDKSAPILSEAAGSSGQSPVPARSLQGDLDAIVAKCLRREAQSRYPTVEALIDDIHRYLDGRAVLARSGSRWYRTTRFLRRNRLPVASAAAVLVAIIAGGAAALWQAHVARLEAQRAEQEAQRAEEEAHRAEAVQDFLVSIFRANTEDQADPVKARDTTARELLAAGAARLEQNTTLPSAARDRLLEVIAQLYTEMDMRETAADLMEKRIAHLRSAGDADELVLALVGFAENVLETNRRDEALPALQEAERIVAARSPMDEALAGTVYSYLSSELSTSNPPLAREYAERAVLHLRRAKPKSEEMLGALFMLTQARRVTNPGAAEAAAREALGVARALHGGQHPLVGDAALYLADIQANLFEAAEAERHFQIAESVALQSTEPHHYLRLQTDLRYGLFLVDIGKLEQGWMRIKRAQQDAIASRGNDDRAYVAWANEYLAKAALQRGNLDEAREYGMMSLNARRQVDPNDLLAKAAELVFDVEVAAGNVDAAARSIREARAAREHVGSATEAGFMQGLMVREADLALAQGDASRAAQLYEQVQKAELPRIQQFIRYRFQSWTGHSRAQLALARFDAAQKSAQKALDELRKLGNPAALKLIEADAWQQLGSALANIGACAKAEEAWNSSRAALAAVSEPASFRFAVLQSARDSMHAKCRAA